MTVCIETWVFITMLVGLLFAISIIFLYLVAWVVVEYGDHQAKKKWTSKQWDHYQEILKSQQQDSFSNDQIGL